MQHVDLYVNDWTLDLGDDGAAALGELSKRAREVGLLASDSRPIEVFAP
jgi:1,4-dihydroxy-6-naphthoate synthase